MSRWTDLADWVGTTHHGGPMTDHRGLVVHIAEGFKDGTVAWQQGDNGVSSHFIVGRDGTCVQMVDTDNASWCQIAGNHTWLSVECEGFSDTAQQHTNPRYTGWNVLTDAQLDTIARLLVRANQEYGVPLQVAGNPTVRGLGHHCMGGVAWGHLDCPGNEIIAQKPAIVARSLEIMNGDDMPSVDDVWNYQTQGETMAGKIDDLHLRVGSAMSARVDYIYNQMQQLTTAIAALSDQVAKLVPKS